MAPTQAERYDDAQDVRTIIDIVKTETGIGEPPGFELLQWHGMSRKSGILGDEKLEVGELNGQEVFACLRKPIDDSKHWLRANLIKLITGDGDTTSQIEPSMLNHIVYTAPFKHIRYHTGTASESDCPIKAFMVACFVLRGHTHEKALKPRALFRVGLITALQQYEQTVLVKGKGRLLARAASAPWSNGKKITVPAETEKGHHVEDVRSHLQKKLGVQTLSYINSLGWAPSCLPGAPERLRIGTRCNTTVFATFNPHAPFAQQLSIIQYGKNRLRIEIQRAGMASVEYDKPYSYLELAGKDTPVAQTKALAQILRTYLKGLFVLRGHSDGQRIAIDLPSFTRTISTIRTAGYTIGSGASLGNDAGNLAAPISGGILNTIEVAPAKNDTAGSSTATKLYKPTLQIHSSSRSTSMRSTPVVDHTRSHTRDTSQATEDNMFYMGNEESSTSRWSAINLPAQKSGTGLYGIFSKATWSSSNVPKILQAPVEPDSRVVRLTSPSSSDTGSVTPVSLAEGDGRVQTTSPQLMLPRADIASELRSFTSPTTQIIPSTSASLSRETCPTFSGAQDPDQDSVMEDDPEEDTTHHKTTPGELLHVMADLVRDTSNEARCTWLKDFITIRTHPIIAAKHHQQLQTYDGEIADLQRKVVEAETAANHEEDEASKVCDDALRELMNGPSLDLNTSIRVRLDTLEDAKMKLKDISERLRANMTECEDRIAGVEAKKALAQAEIERVNLERANAKKRKAQTDDDDLMETILMDMVDVGRDMVRAEKRRRVA